MFMLIPIYYGFLILLAFITWYLPFVGKVLAFGINFVIPEGLPFVDECIQAIGMLRHIFKFKKMFLG